MGSDIGKSRAERIRKIWAICAHHVSLWVRMRRQIARPRADFPQFSEMSDKRETGLHLKFPDHQGKYRELCDFWGFPGRRGHENPSSRLCFFTEFPGNRNREFQIGNREITFPDRRSIRESADVFGPSWL